jgi:hypothetical protein
MDTELRCRDGRNDGLGTALEWRAEVAEEWSDTTQYEYLRSPSQE